MGEILAFESRTGKLNASAESVFNFVTDIRNFSRFVPDGKISNLKLERDECSFKINMLGTVNFSITEKIMYSKVLFSGEALQTNKFSLELKIESSGDSSSGVQVSLKAEMNPFLKVIANDPIRQFLETLITEMENFRDWENTI
jgi:carbon monoxide dehydrogenase subunit G